MANEFVARKGIISLGIISGSGDLNIANNGTIGGNLTVGGTITAQEFKAELISSSIIYESGSTKFGDTIDDTHQRTGSYYISGSTFELTSSTFSIKSPTIVLSGSTTINGTLQATATRADTVLTEESILNTTYRVPFTDFSDPTYNRFYVDTNGLLYNPSTNLLSVGNISASSGLIYFTTSSNYIEDDGATFNIIHEYEINLSAPIASANTFNALSIDAFDITGSNISASGTMTAGTFVGGTFRGTNITGSNISASGTISASSLSLANALPVSSGGTGATTFPSTALLIGNGASAIQTDTFLLYNSGTSTLTTKNLNISDTVKLGDAITDAHTITGSLGISGSLAINGGSTFGAINATTITGSNISASGTIIAGAFSGGTLSGTTLTTTGNAKLGDATADAHTATGSFGISGSLAVNGSSTFAAFSATNITGSNISASGTISASSLSLANALPVSSGGTGVTSFSSNTLLIGNGTSAIQTDTFLIYDGGTSTLSTKNLSISDTVKLGDAITDAHTITGSLGISGSLAINGNITSDITISKSTPTLTIAASTAGSATLTLTPNVTGGTGGIINVNSATLPLLLQTNSTTRIFVSSSGLVGINKTTANAQLDVNGNTIVTGSLTVTSTSALQGVTATTLTTTGNAKIGDATADAHTVTGSLGISGSFAVNGNSVFGLITGSNISASGTIVAGAFSGGSLSGTTLTTTGNAKIGDAITDAHTITGSLGISGSLSLNLSAPIPVASGGTGATTFVNNRVLTGNGTGAIVDEANLTFDGSTLTVTGALTTTGNAKLGDAITDAHTVTGSLNVSGSFGILQSAYGAQISSSITTGTNAVVAVIATGSYNGVFFDYTIGLSTTGRRVGTVMATWLPGGTTVEFTDYSTLDIGSTVGVSMAADIATGNIRLRANNTSGATVEVRAITRAI